MGLGWAVAKRLAVPFAADPREAVLLFAAAALLPVLVGLLSGAAGRRAAVMDALRRDAYSPTLVRVLPARLVLEFQHD